MASAAHGKDLDMEKRLLAKYTIEPGALTCFTRTRTQLEAFLLLCVCAEWGPLRVQASRLAWLLRPSMGAPISWLRSHSLDHTVRLRKLRESGLCPSAETLHDAIVQASTIQDLVAVPLERLTTRTWLSPCYANMFVLHSRKAQHLAVLDDTVLNWLRSKDVFVTRTARHSMGAGERVRLQTTWLELYPASFIGMTAAQADMELRRMTTKEDA